MPIQFPNFERISFDEANPWLVGAERGQRFAQNAIQFPQDMQAKMLANQIAQVQAKYAEPNAQQALQKSIQENKYYAPNIESEIGLRKSQSGYYGTQSQLNNLKIRNPGLLGDAMAQNIALSQIYANNPKLAAMFENMVTSDIGKTNAMAKYYSQGGGSMGVGAKEENLFQNLVAQDNPQLGNDPAKIYEAANALRMGKNQLADGTQLNQLSPAAMESLNRITKYGTTSALINQNIQAQQAEAEMPILNKAINEGVAPYGTTVFNTSPQQIQDSLNVKDKAAQTRLGNYMAAQQLLYDRAALTLKINALPAGVTIADEIKKLSYASVNEKYPMMSASARKIAADKVSKVLEEALKARRSISVGASSVLPNSPFTHNPAVQGGGGGGYDAWAQGLSNEDLQRIVGGG